MPKPIALFFADSHLAERTWAHRPIFGDAYWSFQQIATYAIKHRIPVFGAGDLIDKYRNESGPIVQLCRILDQLAAAQVPFLFIQGNHDLGKVPWFHVSAHAQHMHEMQYEIPGGPVVYGLDFQPAGVLQEALNRIPDNSDILLCHQVWSNFMGSIASPQGGFHDVPVVSKVFTGDFHHNIITDAKGKDGQTLTAISPGSTCLQSIDEPPEKYFCILLDNGKMVNVPLKTRRLVKEHLLREDELDSLIERVAGLLEEATLPATLDGQQVPESCRTPLIQVTYTSRLEDAALRLTKAVGDSGHLFLKELPQQKEEVTQRQQAREKNGQRTAATLDSKLEPFLDRMNRNDLLDPCRRLLDAADIEAELQRMRSEALSVE